ncbi:hypothetical protein M0R36_02155 [bacterium]|jgi:hypothetical protein|nr:hypothetical protein [bacterium]
MKYIFKIKTAVLLALCVLFFPFGCSTENNVRHYISAIDDLEEYDSSWFTFCKGAPAWSIKKVNNPSLDGDALKISILKGSPYANVHFFADLFPEPEAVDFSLSLYFMFRPKTTFNNEGAPSTIQAIEFSMSKWDLSKRYEFALQWQNVGEGAPQWRYWDPHNPKPWTDLGIYQTFEPKKWYYFKMEGSIVDGKVLYRGFTVDRKRHLLGISVRPDPMFEEADHLAVAVQLDANFECAPYDVFIDKVKFDRKTVISADTPKLPPGKKDPSTKEVINFK